MKKRELVPKPVFDEPMLLEAFERNNINKKHAATIWRTLIQSNIDNFESIPGLPKLAVKVLNQEFAISTSTLISKSDAKDFSTTKLLIELQDGQRIESVIMRYGDVEIDSYPLDEKLKKAKDGNQGFKSRKRATLCVSSQVGCAMGCTFCATGTMNLLGNLCGGEILEQLCNDFNRPCQ